MYPAEIDNSFSNAGYVPFYFMHNWRTSYLINYDFRTVVARSKRHIEQRRQLNSRPFRRAKILVSADSDNGEGVELASIITYGADKPFGVPVFSEQFQTTTPIQGNSVFATEDISKFWNLQNRCDYLFLFDYATGESAIKELQAKTGSSVTTASSVASDLDKDSTYFFPILLATVSDFKLKLVTPGFSESELQFVEYFPLTPEP